MPNSRASSSPKASTTQEFRFVFPATESGFSFSSFARARRTCFPLACGKRVLSISPTPMLHAREDTAQGTHDLQEPPGFNLAACISDGKLLTRGTVFLFGNYVISEIDSAR